MVSREETGLRLELDRTCLQRLVLPRKSLHPHRLPSKMSHVTPTHAHTHTQQKHTLRLEAQEEEEVRALEASTQEHAQVHASLMSCAKGDRVQVTRLVKK